MPRDLESLIDLEKAAQRILRFASGVDRTDLIANDEKVSAILYQIAIIGEATKRLSMQFREQHPEIPWRNLAGMRDVIVHEYVTKGKIHILSFIEMLPPDLTLKTLKLRI